MGVTAKDGVVTLSGLVDTLSKKLEAENAAKNVIGVKAVVEKIEVKVPNEKVKADQDIAEDVLIALRNNWSVPDQQVKVKVEKGWVYLEGELAWNYQRDAAKMAVEKIHGIRGVLNNITIKSEGHDKLEEKLVKNAFRRHWSINADDINVDVSGTKVTLTGVVGSIYDKEEAGRIAWKTPGVVTVDNKIVVEYDYKLIG